MTERIRKELIKSGLGTLQEYLSITDRSNPIWTEGTASWSVNTF